MKPLIQGPDSQIGSLNSRLGQEEKQAMVSLLEKMGTAIESMEGDIRQMNNFLKDISLT